MKKLFLFLANILCATGVFAAFQSNGLEYDLQNGVYYVTGLYNESLTSITIPATVNGKNVQGINSNAFKGNTKLTSVTFPTASTFKHINANSFNGCTGLKSIVIPSGIGKITGSNDEGLCTSAFSGCTNLKSVTINSNTLMTSTSSSKGVGDAFLYADTIRMGANVTTIGSYAFYRSASDLALKVFDCNNATTIQTNAFKNAKNLKSISIKKVSTIGEDAFANCTSLTSLSIYELTTDVNLPTTIKTYYIEKTSAKNSVSTFKIYNTGVNTLIFGSDVTNVYEGIIGGTPSEMNIKTITFKNASVKTSGNFQNLTTLTKVTGTPTSIINGFKGCTNLATINISKCTYFGKNVFSGCAAASLTLNNPDITFIGDNAFSGCTKLQGHVNTYNASVGMRAFLNCTGITRASIACPTEYDIETFKGCSNLKHIYFTQCNSASYSEKYNLSSWLGDSSLSIDSISFSKMVPANALSGYAGVKYLCVEDSVTIGKKALYNCANLTQILEYKTNYTYYSERITSIGDSALMKCPKLTQVYFSGLKTLGVSAFNECGALTSATLGNNLTAIPSYAFHSCSALTKVSAPKATSIGNAAFRYCKLLTSTNSISSANDVSIGDNAFFGCFALTSNPVLYATKIGDYAFYACEKLTYARLSKATTIGECAFMGCYLLESVELNKAESIGKEAFSLTKLSSVKLPNTLSELGTSAFSTVNKVEINSNILLNKTYSETNTLLSCFGITNDGKGSITIGDDVTSISEYAFYYDDNKLLALDFIHVGEGVSKYGTRSFYGLKAINSIYLGKNFLVQKDYSKMYCDNLVTIRKGWTSSAYSMKPTSNLHTIFGKNVKEYNFDFQGSEPFLIPQYALYVADGDSSALKRVSASCIRYMLDYSFRNNSNLESIELDSIWSIGAYAFENTALKKVSISSEESLYSTLTVDKYAFSNCKELKTIELNRASLDNNTINATAFAGVSPNLLFDLTDKVQLDESILNNPSCFKSLKVITRTEAAAKEWRKRVKYATSLQRMMCQPEDVNMDGSIDGFDSQAIYNSMK